MEYKVQGLNELSKQLHQFQMDAGFIDGDKTQRMMLIGSELFEAFEAFRKEDYFDAEQYKMDMESGGEWSSRAFENLVKDTHEDEIADLAIRLLAYCGENKIDIEFHIQEKMKYNATRGYKYGGKKF